MKRFLSLLLLVLLVTPAVAETIDREWFEKNGLQRFRRDLFMAPSFVYSADQNQKTTAKDFLIKEGASGSHSFTIQDKNSNAYTHCIKQGDVISCQ